MVFGPRFFARQNDALKPLHTGANRGHRADAPVPDYMALCLLHPQHGYYTTRPPFGAAGDFITAPEISQMFGEMLGLCLAQAWLDQGAPSAVTLAELGPGRGTLMADVLRATRAVAGFHAALRLHLVEASPALQTQQARALAGYEVTWHKDVAGLPDAPLFLLANEFFDALPIRQFHREGAGWAEVVGGAGRRSPEDFGKTAPMQVAALAHRLADTPQGAVVEYCPAAGDYRRGAAAQFAALAAGLRWLWIMGAGAGVGDTFQAHARTMGLPSAAGPPGEHIRSNNRMSILPRLALCGPAGRGRAVCADSQGA
ncbi:MAG: SAM-dependent methyltransferase [Cypionkella sp.]|nr:SAM-dependent methyltransferase [Cypionkella sp.]